MIHKLPSKEDFVVKTEYMERDVYEAITRQRFSFSEITSEQRLDMSNAERLVRKVFMAFHERAFTIDEIMALGTVAFPTVPQNPLNREKFREDLEIALNEHVERKNLRVEWDRHAEEDLYEVNY